MTSPVPGNAWPYFPAATGQVILTGAGPGDPELLTVKALRSLQQADVVVYDLLVSDEILALIPQNVKRIAAGKRCGQPGYTQEEINRILIREAEAGQQVVRLKGGDPLIFGRGGEELEALQAAGIPCSVVPGITAASGCAASALIPLTHRAHASGVRFITGHRQPSAISVPLTTFSDDETLVIYMGIQRAADICAQLQNAGAGKHTPVAVIENGTRAQQRVRIGQLNELSALCDGIRTPGLIIVGSVVHLYHKLHKKTDKYTDEIISSAKDPEFHL